MGDRIAKDRRAAIEGLSRPETRSGSRTTTKRNLDDAGAPSSVTGVVVPPWSVRAVGAQLGGRPIQATGSKPSADRQSDHGDTLPSWPDGAAITGDVIGFALDGTSS